MLKLVQPVVSGGKKTFPFASEPPRGPELNIPVEPLIPEFWRSVTRTSKCAIVFAPTPATEPPTGLKSPAGILFPGSVRNVVEVTNVRSVGSVTLTGPPYNDTTYLVPCSNGPV